MSAKRERPEKSQDGRDGWEEDDQDENSEHHKPKRLEEAVVSYLTDLEGQMDSMGNEDAETRAFFVENVLTEIKQSTASAACDRRTNSAVERICYNASLENVIEILARFTNYAVFLARNRHASHVVQALLARLCSILKFSGIGEVDESTLTATVLQFVRPILKEIAWLIKEQAASHVIRSILCLLAGVPIIAEKKGKTSKHPHSVAFSETLENVMDKKRFYISKEVTFDVPQDFHEAVGLAVLSLVQLSVAELQDLVAEWSSCAVFSVVLRIMASPTIVMGGPELALRLIKATLEWDEAKEEHGAAVFYAMAGDKAGSYFLQTAIECCEEGLLLAITKSAILGRCEDFAKDACANYVLQAVLRKVGACLELLLAGGGAGTGTGEEEDAKERNEEGGTGASKTDQKALEKVAQSLLKELSSKKQFRSLLRTKGGLVLWMLELARFTARKQSRREVQEQEEEEEGEGDEKGETRKTKQKQRDSWSQRLGMMVLQQWAASGGEDDGDGDGDGDDGDGGDGDGGGDDHGRIKNTLVRLLQRGESKEGNNNNNDNSDDEEKVKEKEKRNKIARARRDMDVSNGAKTGKERVVGQLDSSTALLTARLVEALMKGGGLGGVYSVQEKLVRALCLLPSSSFLHIATSGPLSRGVLDPLSDYCSQAVLLTTTNDNDGDGDGDGMGTSSSGGQRKRKMRSSLAADLLMRVSSLDVVEMACHYIGQHCFRKVYDACVDITAREHLVKALNESRERVNKCKEGRASMKACNGDLYKKKPEEWALIANRQAKARHLLLGLTSESREEEATGLAISRQNRSNGGHSGADGDPTGFLGKRESSGSKSGGRPEVERDNDNNEVGKLEHTDTKKKKKKRSGNNASRETWFRENRDRLSKGRGGTGGGRGGRGSIGRGEQVTGYKRDNAHIREADFAKISTLKSAKLNLNLNTVVSELQK